MIMSKNRHLLSGPPAGRPSRSGQRGRSSARAPAQVSFVALGPAGLRIEGKSSDLQVTDRPDALVVTVPLAKLETGISLRDHHMQEKYLESQKYPNAQLAVARSAIKFPGPGQTTEGTVPATLALHGKSKTVPVHYKAIPQRKRLRREGRPEGGLSRVRHRDSQLPRRHGEAAGGRQRRLRPG